MNVIERMLGDKFKEKKARALSVDAHAAALRNVLSSVIIICWTSNSKDKQNNKVSYLRIYTHRAFENQLNCKFEIATNIAAALTMTRYLRYLR